MELWPDVLGLLRCPATAEQMQGKLPGDAGLPARNTDPAKIRQPPKVYFASDDLQRELHLNQEDILELCKKADLAIHDMMDPSMPFTIEIPKARIPLAASVSAQSHSSQLSHTALQTWLVGSLSQHCDWLHIGHAEQALHYKRCPTEEERRYRRQGGWPAQHDIVRPAGANA